MFNRGWKIVLAAVLGLAVTGGLALSGVAFLAPSATAAEREREERHPHIHAAIEELREARRELKDADHDFDGHRKEAVEAIDTAIHQLEVCLKHDRK